MGRSGWEHMYDISDVLPNNHLLPTPHTLKGGRRGGATAARFGAAQQK